MIFRNEKHKQDYEHFLSQMRKSDCYHNAVAYLLALDVVLIAHVTDVFDFDEDWIKPETALANGWQTSTSRRTTRLLMNLWNGWCCECDDTPSPNYAVDEIFCCSYAPYYWEAVKLRYPEYTLID